jgi:hypothetical protein
MFELRISVGIMAAFQGLAVHLPTVFQQAQQFWDTAIRDLVAHLAQCRSQFRVALRHPLRIPVDREHGFRLIVNINSSRS